MIRTKPCCKCYCGLLPRKKNFKLYCNLRRKTVYNFCKTSDERISIFVEAAFFLSNHFFQNKWSARTLLGLYNYWSQFHQHFRPSFHANFLLPKKIGYKKTLHNILYKKADHKMLVKFTLDVCFVVQNRCLASPRGWIPWYQYYFLNVVYHAVFIWQTIEITNCDRDRLRYTTELHCKTYLMISSHTSNSMHD